MYTYGLPRHSEEKLRWIKAIPRINPSIIDKKKKTFVCEKHWPTGFKPSEIPTPPPLQERQKKSSFTVRSREEDQRNAFTDAFIDADQVTSEELKSKVSTRTFCAPVVSFKTRNILWIQSAEFLSGIPTFAIQIIKI